MENAQPDPLEQRVERLEKSIGRLESLTARLLRSREVQATATIDESSTPDSIELLPPARQTTPPPPVTPATESSATESSTSDALSPEHEERKRRAADETIAAYKKRQAESLRSENWVDSFLSTENWLGKVGIGLLLFGLVFLFKYSVDQGWLTPTVRLLLGVALGVGLVSSSSRVYNEKRYLSLILFGGGVASFFVTDFAAFQVFSLVTYPVAFASLGAVTIITFFVSLKQDESVLSLVAVIGGFATPFLLYSDNGTLSGLLMYSALLVGCACSIYFFKGWRSLLWLTVLGGWYILGFGLITASPFSEASAAGDRITMQLGILFTWIVFAVVPLYREIISDRDTSSHPGYFSGDHQLGLSESQHLFRRQHLFVLITMMPLLTLLFSTRIWSLPDLTSGLIIMSGAALYGGAAWAQYKSETAKDFFPFHALAGIILFTISLAVILDGRALLVALAAEALILHELGLRYFGSETRMLAHLVFAIVLVGLVDRLLDPFAGSLSFLSPGGLTDMAILTAGAFVSFRSPSKMEKSTYGGIVHVCFLALIYRELIFLESGQGIVTIVWGAFAVLLFVLGLLRKITMLRILGTATLLVVVAKLFIIDLAALETIWRVLLFMGFGGLFLLLSYYFKELAATEENEE